MALFATLCVAGPIALEQSETKAGGPAPDSEAPAPRLTFEQPVYDFGIAGEKQKITHTFRFTNTGAAPLEITGVKTGCRCTAAILSATDTPPGESGAIRATLETFDHEGKEERRISVRSNDPAQPETALTILGRIKTGLALVPQGLHLGSIQEGNAATGRVRLLQLSDNRLAVDRVEFNEKYLAVTTSRFTDENNRGINIDITVKPEAPVGRLSEVVTLHTSVKQRSRVDIPVWANVVGRTQ